MRLCFDATRFGSGLDGAIDLASARQLTAVEYSLAPFNTSSRSSKNVKGDELKYFQSVGALAEERGVEIACLNLDYTHSPGGKGTTNFLRMLTKLASVAEAVHCPRISFFLTPGVDDKWKDSFEAEYKELEGELSERGVKPLLRLSTPVTSRGVSLKRWIAMEPQDWRDLLSSCSGLALSFSPADCVWLGIDYLQILPGITSAIEHIEANDIEIHREILKDSGMYGPLWWRYRKVGKGQVDWRQFIEALKLYGYEGTFSIHLDDEFIAEEPTVLEDALDEGIKELGRLVRDF